jgi:hypothetical protein
MGKKIVYPQVINYIVKNSQVMTGGVSKKSTHKWNFTLKNQSKIIINFELYKHPRILKNIIYNLTVSIIKYENAGEKNVLSFNLNKGIQNYNNNIILDSGTYSINVSYPTLLVVHYNFKLDIEELPLIPAIPAIPAKKYALIVSITDYLYINDLSYCDEDAISWCNFLSKNNYEIYLLGDKTSTYGEYKLNDFATESNVKKTIALIANKVKANDQFVFISSGHGSGDGKGNSFICCLDANQSPNGQYTDKELAADIKLITDKKTKVILFFDNCFSGGLIPEVVGDDPQLVCATSTCTENGYGFDVEEYKQGAWTYHFLIQTLQKNPTGTINQIFTKALISYPFKQGNLPQLGGNGSLKF